MYKMKNGNRLDEILHEVARVKQQYRRAIEQLRNDETRSQQGRAELMNKEWEQTKNKVASLRDEYQTEIKDQRAMLEHLAFEVGSREYFNTIQNIMGMDREQKDKAFSMALKVRDSEMLKAFGALAHSEQNWGALEQISQFDKDVRNLIEFENEHNPKFNRQKWFELSVFMSAPTQPDEVQRKEHLNYQPG
jgi:hypothetical protein